MPALWQIKTTNCWVIKLISENYLERLVLWLSKSSHKISWGRNKPKLQLSWACQKLTSGNSLKETLSIFCLLCEGEKSIFIENVSKRKQIMMDILERRDKDAFITPKRKPVTGQGIVLVHLIKDILSQDISLIDWTYQLFALSRSIWNITPKIEEGKVGDRPENLQKTQGIIWLVQSQKESVRYKN